MVMHFFIFVLVTFLDLYCYMSITTEVLWTRYIWTRYISEN